VKEGETAGAMYPRCLPRIVTAVLMSQTMGGG
jgi:hypothetical protein